MTWRSFSRGLDQTPSEGTIAIAIQAPEGGRVSVYEEGQDDVFSVGMSEKGEITILAWENKWLFSVAGESVEIAEIKESSGQ